MTLPFRKYSVAVTTVALACFGLGYATSGGAHEIESHRAVGKAIAAAREVDTLRQELESSLAEARVVASEASTVADDARVEAAAQELSVASSKALAVARENGVPVDSGSSSETSYSSANTVPAVAASAAPQPADSQIVTEVLSGDVDGIDAARDATSKLEDASDALDQALAEVAEQVASVEAATELASLATNLEELDAGVASAPETTASAAVLLEAVGLQVTDAASIASVRQSTAELERVAGEASDVDRTSPAEVADVHQALREAADGVEEATGAVTRSHQSWIDRENTRRTAINDQRVEDHEAAVTAAWESYAAANLEFAAARSNGWSGAPASLDGANGRIPRDDLCELSFAPGHYLQCDAADALTDADAAYFDETGRHLVMTDSYRSYGLQVTTRARKPSTAAMPGTSNHGWGMAVDLNPASAAWLSDNGAEFGWIRPDWAEPSGAKPESWHLEYVAPEVGGFVEPQEPELLPLVKSALDKD